ncbi:hypothetical protein [Komagataeibacter saccharivorans]|uniref:hypothetical protein n=1 Tax=Komagataeibacter saccharivorans TaxID=265959 RepID=UPI0011B4D34B|nr:hypothetical protein [Komagataeibacter saccharivorans]
MLAFRAIFPRAGATGRMDGNRAIAEVSGEDFFKKIQKNTVFLKKGGIRKRSPVNRMFSGSDEPM